MLILVNWNIGKLYGYSAVNNSFYELVLENANLEGGGRMEKIIIVADSKLETISDIFISFVLFI